MIIILIEILIVMAMILIEWDGCDIDWQLCFRLNVIIIWTKILIVIAWDGCDIDCDGCGFDRLWFCLCWCDLDK